MKLVKARIEKYKCVEDSEEWRVGQVTCLVGKNEAGKSALLEALHKLNPDDATAEMFAGEDYPRRFAVSPQGQEDLKSANVLTTTWLLDQGDCDGVNEEFPGLDLKADTEVVLRNGYDNVRRWSIRFDEESFVTALIERARLNAAESAPLKACSSVRGLAQKLSALETKTDKQKLLQELVKRHLPESNPEKAIANKLKGRLPKLLYFKEYYRLPGRVAINDLLERREDPSRYTFDFRVSTRC